MEFHTGELLRSSVQVCSASKCDPRTPGVRQRQHLHNESSANFYDASKTEALWQVQHTSRVLSCLLCDEHSIIRPGPLLKAR